MSISAAALEMRLAIRRLQRQHQSVAEPCNIPLAPPFDHPMILVGLASTCDVDSDRTRLRPYAFGFPLPRHCRDVPLLLKHRLDQVAGSIEELELRRPRIADHSCQCHAFSDCPTLRRVLDRRPRHRLHHARHGRPRLLRRDQSSRADRDQPYRCSGEPSRSGDAAILGIALAAVLRPRWREDELPHPTRSIDEGAEPMTAAQTNEIRRQLGCSSSQASPRAPA